MQSLSYMPKYSIIMPYLHRYQHLKNTLVSFEHHYEDRDDYEIIIVEDLKNYQDVGEHALLQLLIDQYEDVIDIKHIQYTRQNCYNPAEMFNRAVEQAQGEYIVLTNPECYHESDILGGFDKYIEEDPIQYVICACKSIVHVPDVQHFEQIKQAIDQMWYVHSEHYPRKIHFCTCISKENYTKVNGFDTDYLEGIGFEDDDFVKRVETAGITMTHADELVVLHQDHSRSYGVSHQDLTKINKQIYDNKWRNND